jgi:hypothetical protein
MFLASDPRIIDAWCISDMDMIDQNDEAIEDTVSISFYQKSNDQ